MGGFIVPKNSSKGRMERKITEILVVDITKPSTRTTNKKPNLVVIDEEKGNIISNEI